MKREDLLLFLQDIVEQDSDLVTLKYRYTTYGDGAYSLDILKKIAIYGLKLNLFEFSKYEINKEIYVDIDLKKSLELINKDDIWINVENDAYYLTFVNIPYYFFILFGPNGPVGEHAMEGARIPEEFGQFIIDS